MHGNALRRAVFYAQPPNPAHLKLAPVPKLRWAASVESGRRNPQVIAVGLEEPAGARFEGCIDAPLLVYTYFKSVTCGMNRAHGTTCDFTKSSS